VQNLFCLFALECKIYFACLPWSAKFILLVFWSAKFILLVCLGVQNLFCLFFGVQNLFCLFALECKIYFAKKGELYFIQSGNAITFEGEHIGSP